MFVHRQIGPVNSFFTRNEGADGKCQALPQ
jgi:hypothetical protein